jgi:3-dehydroquinate synthase
MLNKTIISKILYFDSFQGFIYSLLKNCADKRVFITNKKLYKLLNLSVLEGRKIIISGDGESCKSFSNAALIVKGLLKRSVFKSDIITVIGGGSLCDLGAFCASIYKRGSRLALAPTSLLAMVDAAHGGKTALNENGFKNCAGTFYPASEIMICADFLTTLPAAQIESGLFEAIKYGILFSKKLFIDIISRQDSLIKYNTANRELFIDIIKKCVRYKNKITGADPFDKNERLALNFGHTFGHAFEGAAGPELSHGCAVGLGMFMELFLARVKYGESKENLNAAGMLLKFIRKSGAHKTLDRVIKQKDIFNNLYRYIIHDKKAGAAGSVIKMPVVKKPGLYSLEEISAPEDIKRFLKRRGDIIDAWTA